MLYSYQKGYKGSTAWSRVVMQYLQEVQGCDVRDLTDDMGAQKTGIDFLVNEETAEFKTCDRIHETGNIAFETISNSRKATPGACLTSQAQSLYWFDTVLRLCHVVDFPALRMAFDESEISSWRAYKVRTQNPHNPHVLAYASYGFLIPLSFIRENLSGKYTVLDVAPWYRKTMACARCGRRYGADVEACPSCEAPNEAF